MLLRETSRRWTMMDATLNHVPLEQEIPVRYDSNTILLHWLTAGLVATLWVSEQVIDIFSKTVRDGILSLHITLGVVLALVLLARVIWRVTNGHSLPAADQIFMELAARATHVVLYIGVATAVTLGIALELVRGDLVWGLMHLPSIAPGNKALTHAVKGYHGLAANFVLIIAGLHAAAALFHHYVLRDGVLRRMLPGA
jgi:cytochrome b561